MITRSNRAVVFATTGVILALVAVAFYLASVLGGMSMTTASDMRPLADDPTGAMCELVTVKIPTEEYNRRTTDLFAYAEQHPEYKNNAESGNRPCGVVKQLKQHP